jgi:hypothetical protein
MRRLSLLGAVVVIAALLVPGIGVAKPKSHAYKFSGVVKVSEISIVDAKGDGASAGDVYTFTLNVFDKAGKKQVATGHGYCILGAPNFSTCTSVTDDGKGKIVLTWEDDGDASTAEEVAITGGTRKYRNIRGDGKTKQVSASDPTTFTVKLKGTF